MCCRIRTKKILSILQDVMKYVPTDDISVRPLVRGQFSRLGLVLRAVSLCRGPYPDVGHCICLRSFLALDDVEFDLIAFF
jgi:hypothetical protein